MKKNIHDYERIFRVIGGVVLTSMVFWGPKSKWFSIFLAPVATGFVGTCPLYSAFGVTTRPRATTEEQANDYFPIQSPSEKAAGHPIVGVS